MVIGFLPSSNVNGSVYIPVNISLYLQPISLLHVRCNPTNSTSYRQMMEGVSRLSHSDTNLSIHYYSYKRFSFKFKIIVVERGYSSFVTAHNQFSFVVPTETVPNDWGYWLRLLWAGSSNLDYSQRQKLIPDPLICQEETQLNGNWINFISNPQKVSPFSLLLTKKRNSNFGAWSACKLCLSAAFMAIN